MAIQTYEITKKQSLLDACIQVYGTSKLLFQFAKDNGLQIDSGVNIGDELLYNDILGDQDLKNKIEGEGFIINNPGGIIGLFEPEYQAVYDEFTTKPNNSIALAQNTLVKTLVDGGIWSKFDVFYMFAQTVNSDGEALKNWINPALGTFDATLVNAPIFKALEGFKGDGATSYINSNYKPLTDKIQSSLNSFAHGGYLRDNLLDGLYSLASVLYPAGFTDNIQLIPKFGNQIFFTVNSAANTITPNAVDSPGLFISNRISPLSVEAYINKIKKATIATVSTGMPDVPIYLLARNINGTASSFMNNQISLYHLGSKLTEIDVTILTDAFEAYMDSNGKGVI